MSIESKSFFEKEKLYSELNAIIIEMNSVIKNYEEKRDRIEKAKNSRRDLQRQAINEPFNTKIKDKIKKDSEEIAKSKKEIVVIKTKIKELFEKLNKIESNLLDPSNNTLLDERLSQLLKDLDDKYKKGKIEGIIKSKDKILEEIIAVIELNFIREHDKDLSFVREYDLKNIQAILKSVKPKKQGKIDEEDEPDEDVDELKKFGEDVIGLQFKRHAKTKEGLEADIISTAGNPLSKRMAAFVVKHTVAPLKEVYNAVVDAGKSIVQGTKILFNKDVSGMGRKHFADGLLRGVVILGAATGMGYGIAMGIVALGVIALVSNPFTLAGGLAIAGLLATAIVASKALRWIAKKITEFSNEKIDKTLEIYNPTKRLIEKIGEENAFKISHFIKNEIEFIEKIIQDPSTSEEEKKIHIAVLKMIEHVWKEIQKGKMDSKDCIEKLKDIQSKIEIEYKNLYDNVFVSHVSAIFEKTSQTNNTFTERLSDLQELGENRQSVLIQFNKFKSNLERFEKSSKALHEKIKIESPTPKTGP